MADYKGNTCPVCKQKFKEADDIVVCPDCGKQHAIFGESHIEAIAAKHGIPNTAKLPIDPAIAAACDAGKIEDVQGDWLSSLADAIEGK